MSERRPLQSSPLIVPMVFFCKKAGASDRVPAPARWRPLDPNQWPSAREDASGRQPPTIRCFSTLLLQLFRNTGQFIENTYELEL